MSIYRTRRRRKPLRRPWLSIVPRLTCEEAIARFRHADLPMLSPAEIWGERVRLTEGLARRLHDRRRWDRTLITPSGEVLRESEWISERLARLDAESRARRGYRA